MQESLNLNPVLELSRIFNNIEQMTGFWILINLVLALKKPSTYRLA